jgi:DNA-3-methyladenine glycosylase
VEEQNHPEKQPLYINILGKGIMNHPLPPAIKKKYNLNPIHPSFYSASAVTVAKELLGKYFYSHQDQLLGRIVETEAYPGDDPINHGTKKKTERKAAMFLPPGYCYVYNLYYKNLCFNISVEKEGIPSVVLIRAVEPLEGIDTIFHNRKQKNIKNLTNGPSKLCQAFDITISDNGKELTETCFNIYEGIQSDFEVIQTGRIGVKEVNPRPYRFYIKDNLFVSKSGLRWGVSKPAF